MEIILASASQRREELLRRIIKDFSIIVSDFDEDSVIFNGNCEDYVKTLAFGKAMNVAKTLKNKSIVIGCDTVVYHNNKILGKPNDKEEAYSMIRALSGNVHKVYSGIALINTVSNISIIDYVCTDVFFAEISDDEINKYIHKNEWADKAGAYGIQGNAGIFVEKIHGCYYNVVGLPLNRLYNMLKEMGVNL
ncbi:Maf-like protein [Clostridium sp. SYSU_GA19001]|uniref:Maf-like protein n=1 Tax=Clostridium caldaquaticum TaxID=2940653 RepID=UPI0020775EB3|nr:Maf-like protein [Clostridium caldaquaticum]MCM8710363.1 Maf-like protein [Clostridium caldaquaticum]